MTSPQRAPRPTPRGLPHAAPAGDRRGHLRVVDPPAPPRRRPRTAFVASLVVVVLFGALFVGAVLQSFLVSGQAHLDQVEGQVRDQSELLRREELALAQAQSPANIARAAEELGMVPPDRQVWISPEGGSDPVVTGETDDPAGDPSTDPTGDTGTDGSELAAP